MQAQLGWDHFSFAFPFVLFVFLCLIPFTLLTILRLLFLVPREASLKSDLITVPSASSSLVRLALSHNWLLGHGGT